MSDRRFSTVEVCEMTGATYRQCDYWVRLGIFGPVNSICGGGRGSGSKRRWTESQAIITRALVQVSPMHVRGLGGAAEQIRTYWEADPALTDTWLVVTPKGALVTPYPPRVVSAALVVNLEACAAYVSEAAAAMMAS